MLVISALATATGIAITPATAGAIPVRATVPVGNPPRALAIDVLREGSEVVVRAAGTAVARFPEPDSDVRARVDPIRLGPSAIAAVHVEGRGRWVVIVTGPARSVWAGRTDPRGDPGERTAEWIQVVRAEGDATASVYVGRTSERVRVCGATETVLTRRRLDPSTLRLVSAPTDPVSDREPPIVVPLHRQPPAGLQSPIARGRSLHAVGASSRHDDVTGAPSDAPPVAVADGRVETFWAEGRPDGGHGEFVTLRVETSGLPVRAVSLVPVPQTTALLGRARRLLLVADRGPPLDVSIPADASPGERFWLAVPTPEPWRCLSVVLRENEGPPVTALGEVDVHTELDFAGGLERLFERLETDEREGARLALVLGRLGQPAIDLLASRWSRMTAVGRRRAVAMLEAALPLPRAAELLAETAAGADPEIAATALRVLIERRDTDEALARLVATGRDPGGRATRTLLARAPRHAAIALLARLGDAPDDARARAALGRVAPHPEARRIVETWLDSTPAGPHLPSALLALAVVEPLHAHVTRALRRAIESSTRFEDRWRLAAAAAAVPPDPSIDAWLSALVREAPEWMLREAALRALGPRAGPMVLEAALADGYPRVRATALRMLSPKGDAVRLTAVARTDPWPVARAAAIAAIGRTRHGRAVLLAATRDRWPSVRAAALEALSERGDPAATTVASAFLLDADERPATVEAAIGHVRRRCDAAVADAIERFVQRMSVEPTWHPLAPSLVPAFEALASVDPARARAVAERTGLPALRAALDDRSSAPSGLPRSRCLPAAPDASP
ncbi:MAG: hypothetical protein NZ898_06555 [Myxococcota bacterium]|nr:hypothetical protein [Myxococcota bacterium]